MKKIIEEKVQIEKGNESPKKKRQIKVQIEKENKSPKRIWKN